MNFHLNLLKNKKGIGTVFGMVFFLLIVMVVFASFVIILNQNTGLEQTTIQAKQLDLDRYTELTTVSVTNPEIAVLNSVVYISCTITNNGTLPAELVRLWIKDITHDTVGNTVMSPTINLQPGHSIQYFNSSYVTGASIIDQFGFWFITTRGNTISGFPDTSQFKGIVSTGTFPGVTDINSTYNGEVYHPLQLSLTTTKPNQLIYVIVSYDDENTLYTPTSTPSLTWTRRSQSLDTDYGTMDGDSTLETYYAIKPSTGPLQINIQSTADEYYDYYCSALAFAISDVNTASPFDGAAQTTVGKSIMPSDTITTHYSNDMIIGALSIDSLNPVINFVAPFGEIMPVQSSYGASGEPDAQPRSVWSEWAIIDAPRTNFPVNCTFTSAKNWAIIVDAVRLIVVPPVSPITLSPTSGPIGQPVTVSGQGFATNSQLIATLDGSQIPFSFTTDSSGNIPPNAIFTIPQGSTAGTKNITIIDSKFNYASANFVVTTPSITASPQSGPSGTTITVIGSNFITNLPITINFDGNPTITNPSTVTTNAAGGFSATFSSSGSAGIKHVVASDGINSAYADFIVIPSITLNLNQGPKNTIVTVSGNGFAATSNIGITFGGTVLSTTPSTIITDSAGAFNALFNVPSSTAGESTIIAIDASSNTASSVFTVTVPSISLVPTSAKVGSTVTISGSNFIANSQITIMLDSTLITTITSTATGSIPAGVTFIVPTIPAGVHVVTCTDSTNNVATSTLTVIPNTILNPATGPYGTSVSITGQGFAASASITLSFNGVSLLTSPSQLQTDNSGSFSGSFIVPSSSAGTKNVIATDGTNSYINTFNVITRTITLNPTSGSNGASVTITGSNFEPTQAIAINFDLLPLTTFPSTVISSATGAFSCTFNVPITTSGSHTVSAGDTVPDAVSASFTVIASSLTLNPSNGPIGTSVTVTGSNFLPNSPLTVTYNGVTVANPTSTATGTILAGVSFLVPASTFGSHPVVVADGFGNSASATFTVSASLTLSPVTGLIGTAVTASGQGFAASSTVTLTFGGTTATTTPTPIQTDIAGSFTCAFNVQSTTAGAKTVTATDSVPHSVSTTFTVSASSISLSPTTGPQGTSVTVTGSNFVPNSAVTVTFGGNGITTNPVSIVASGTGAFSATFTVPASTSGAKTVTATDAATNTGSATFTVTSSSVTLTPSSGRVASSVTVSGSNFIPNSALTIRYDGSIVASPTATATGAIPAGVTFTVPASVAGAHVVQTTDGSNTVSVTFTVTPAIVLNPTSGLSGTSVSVSGTGFAATRSITAIFAGSAVAVSGTTTTDATGSFSAATFTVPASTSGAKTVIVADAGTNSASASFTVRAPFGLDGFASAGSGTHGQPTLTLSTTQANDVIVLMIVQNYDHTFAPTDTAGLTWTERPGVPEITSDTNEEVDEWWAIAPSALTNDVINLHESGSSSHNTVAVAFAISGANTATPFDTNSGIPYSAHGASGTPSISGVSTSNANDIIIGLAGYRGITTSANAAATYTLITSPQTSGSGTTQQWGAAEYKQVAATQPSITVTWGNTLASNDWAMIVDAVMQAP